MAELGAVASVLQVAQFGAQLSLTLYNVAQTVKTANQDVKRIAKEIALFAQVLKDLGSALERGQGSKLYRGDAYDTSRMIVEECEGVFKEIEEILFKRTTKGPRAFDAALSIPKAERFLWVFRKGRVQLLRSNLESLKSTISLKLAVLTYADRHASSIKRSDDADDVLSLKSLVLANETATGELREFTTSTRQGPEDLGSEHIWSPGPIATHGIWNLSPTDKQMGSSFKRDFLTPTTTSEPAASLVTPSLNTIPRLTHYNGDPKSRVLTYPKLSTTATVLNLSSSISPKVYAESSNENAAGSQECSEHRRRFWGNQDKLELAVKKLDVAIWELGRIENNIKLGRPVEHEGQQYSLLIHLQHGLGLFGMSSEQIHWAMNRLANCNTFLCERTETIQEISKSDVDLRGLQNQGITFVSDKENYDRLIINRWLPDFFEDILWSHMKQRTHDMGGVLGAEQVHSTPKLYRMSQSLGQRAANCNYPRCDKVLTREPYQCGVAGCQKSFHRPDLLARHMERQHNDPESQHYRHGRSLSQVSMAESDAAHAIMAITVLLLSPNTMLETATQPSSATSIYSIVDHNTPPGFVNQHINTLNDLSQLPVPTGPHGFAPDLVYGATTSNDSPFYSSDSCYSPNPEYPHARIAGQSYVPRHDGQHPPSLPSFVSPSSQQRSCLQTTSTLPAWLETGTNPNDGTSTNPSSKSTKLEPGTVSNTSATNGRAITSPSAERKRKNTRISSDENAELYFNRVAHGPPSPPSRPTWSRQILSTERSPPQKLRRTMKKSVVNDNAESNVNAEANEATEEAPRVDPDQAVKNLLRKWTTLLDMPLRPSYGK